MKKLVSSLLIGSLAFANIYNSGADLKKLTLPISFKTTTQTYIKNVAISSDDKKMLVSAESAVKVFDVEEGELIKLLKFKEVREAGFSDDNSKIFIATKKRFYIYDAFTYKEISHMDGNDFTGFFSKGNFLGVLDGYKNRCSLFNIVTGSKITSFDTHNYPRKGAFSPTTKKFAIAYYYKALIYNRDGVLLNSLPKSYYRITDLKWIDKNRVVVVSDNTLYVYNVKTSQLLAKTKNIYQDKTYQIDKVAVLDNDNILVFDNDKMRIFNLSKSAFLNKMYLIPGKDSYDDVTAVKISQDKRFLSVAYYSKNMKFYDISKLSKNHIKIDNKETKSQTTPQSVQPKVIIKKEIVEKKVYIQSKANKKPTVEIYASQTEGIVPLKVNFKFIANDEDGKIVSYYLNFAGKEIMHKGNPSKSFTYTFRNAGKYNIMIAVKDNKGAVATKKITINAREESFDDFQKGLMGH